MTWHINQRVDYQDEGTQRLESFSDSVIAIAITLLVLTIKVPQGVTSLQQELIQQWPAYLSYSLSFIIIGIIWANHHNMFKSILRSDFILMLLNILFLMCVAFIPFPTALLAEHIQKPVDRQTVVLIYTGTLFLTAITYSSIWWYASHQYRLIDKDFDLGLLKRINLGYFVGPILYLFAFMLAPFSYQTSLVMCVFLALIFTMPRTNENRLCTQVNRHYRNSLHCITEPS